jgi:hypothetical protein
MEIKTRTSYSPPNLWRTDFSIIDATACEPAPSRARSPAIATTLLAALGIGLVISLWWA